MMFEVLGTVLLGCLSVASGQIPSSPDTLCLQNVGGSDAAQGYGYKSSYYLGEYDEDYRISVIDSTWCAYDHATYGSISSTSNCVVYCSSMPSDYTPTSSDIGDPSDCDEWSNGKAKMTSKSSDCAAFDTNLSWIDWIILSYAALVFCVIIMFVCPFGPFHYWCKYDTYPSIQLSTYAQILELRGFDPKAARSEKDARTIDEAVLQHDLLRNKLIWENDFKKDYFLFLRMEHPLLSLFYGHNLHPFSISERRVSFLGIQCFSIGLAALFTYAAASANIQNNVLSFVLGFLFDWVFGFLVSFINKLYEFAATCEGAERLENKSLRKCIMRLGHCGMCFLLVFCMIFGGAMIGVLFNVIASDYPDVPETSVAFVFIVNYLTGTVFSWFLIDLWFDSKEFEEEWWHQKGMHPKKIYFKCPKFLTCCCNCNFNAICCISYMLGCCCCYYCCCKKAIEKGEKREYAKDENGNVIGSQDGAFGVSWQDYENFKSENPLGPHRLDSVLLKIGVKNKSVLDVSVSASATPKQSLDQINNNNNNIITQSDTTQGKGNEVTNDYVRMEDE